MTNERTAWGWGLASIDAAGNTLDVWYPQLTLGAVPEGANPPQPRVRGAGAAAGRRPWRAPRTGVHRKLP